MSYLHNFLWALIFTDIVETIILFLLLWYVFKKREKGWLKIVFIGLFASFATLPYVWFVFPSLISLFSYSVYLTVAELFAFILEALLYRFSLDLDWKIAFLVSFICNFISCVLGLFLQLHGIWFHW